ncbi:MAG: hypothetical protein AAB110_02820, partial [Candidatus Desantisbacteria bacterium]
GAPGADVCPKWSPCGRYIINGWEGGVSLVDLLYGNTEISLTPEQTIGPIASMNACRELRKFREYLQTNDIESWNALVKAH